MVTNSTVTNSTVPQRSAKMVEGNEFFVEAVIAERHGADAVREFLVKWDGYPAEEATWEPLDNINSDLVYEWLEEKYKLEEICNAEDDDLTTASHEKSEQVPPSGLKNNKRARTTEEDGGSPSASDDQVTNQESVKRLKRDNGELGLLSSQPGAVDSDPIHVSETVALPTFERSASVESRQVNTSVEGEEGLANMPDLAEQGHASAEAESPTPNSTDKSDWYPAEIRAAATPSPSNSDFDPAETLFAAPGIEVEVDIMEPPGGVDPQEWRDLLSSITSINDGVW